MRTRYTSRTPCESLCATSMILRWVASRVRRVMSRETVLPPTRVSGHTGTTKSSSNVSRQLLLQWLAATAPSTPSEDISGASFPRTLSTIFSTRCRLWRRDGARSTSPKRYATRRLQVAYGRNIAVAFGLSVEACRPSVCFQACLIRSVQDSSLSRSCRIRCFDGYRVCSSCWQPLDSPVSSHQGQTVSVCSRWPHPLCQSVDGLFRDVCDD